MRQKFKIKKISLKIFSFKIFQILIKKKKLNWKTLRSTYGPLSLDSPKFWTKDEKKRKSPTNREKNEKKWKVKKISKKSQENPEKNEKNI